MALALSKHNDQLLPLHTSCMMQTCWAHQSVSATTLAYSCPAPTMLEGWTMESTQCGTKRRATTVALQETACMHTDALLMLTSNLHAFMVCVRAVRMYAQNVKKVHSR
jgi:hypothetical protein